MDFRDKEFLDRLMHLTEDNNKLLHSLHRSARISRWLRILYVIIVVGISIGAFYYIQPLFESFMSAFGISHESLKEFFDSFSVS